MPISSSEDYRSLTLHQKTKNERVYEHIRILGGS